MKQFSRVLLGIIFPAMLFWTFTGIADDNSNHGNNDNNSHAIKAVLDGFQQNPPVFSAGSGDFTGSLNSDTTGLDFTLTYKELSSNPTTIQILFSQPGNNGGVIATLCGATSNPCQSSPGSLTGMITASNIIALPEQGIIAGEFAKFLEVIRQGKAFINISTTRFRNGEILGKIEWRGNSWNNGKNQGNRSRD
jgi:hypothetical protein